MGEKGRRSKRRGDSWVAVALRVFVAAIAGFAATWQAATSAGMIAAAVGAMVGVIVGEVIGRSRARLPFPILLGLGFFLSSVLGWSLLTRWPAIAEALGLELVIYVSDAVSLALLAAAVCLLLRSLGSRYRIIAAVELVLIGAALAAPLAAHRGGAINRPLPLGDFAWSQGEDPVIYLQIAGGVAALGLAMFLITELRWLRALSAALLVLLATVTMGFFASLIQPPELRPDGGLGLTGQGREQGQGRSKGSRSLDNLDFRDNYGSKQRSAPVAVVLLHDDYEPRIGAYYFRQKAFSRYNGRRMVPALDAGVDVDVFDVFPSTKRRARWVPPEPFRTRVETSVALLQDHVNPVVLEAGETVSPAKNPAPRRFRRAYKATSLALDVSPIELVGLPVGDPAWPAEVQALYTEAPTDPRYRELAQKIVNQLPEELRDDNVARALVIANDLGRRGIYSLRSGHASAEDPTASFLFGDMTGYCVHFAHAAVYLFRSIGIPARLATGYQYPANQRGRGSSLLLRGADAHAWPEVFVQGVGWIVVDITPARNLEPPGMPLDPELQRMLGEMLRGQLEDQRRASMAVGETPRFIGRFFAALQVSARLVLVLIVVALFLAYFIKGYRRLAPAVVGDDQRTRVSYRLALDRLSEVGLRRKLGEPPESFARRVGELAPSLAALTRAICARRFGSRVADEPAASRALERQIKSEIRSGTRWWRRLLGLLDPSSWIRVR